MLKNANVLKKIHNSKTNVFYLSIFIQYIFCFNHIFYTAQLKKHYIIKYYKQI